MNRKVTILLIALVALFHGVLPAEGEQKAPASEPEPIGFTWWNDLPEMIRRGNEDYSGNKFSDAERLYRDAQLKNPEEAVAAFNLGLSAAKQDNHEAAINQFKKSLNLAGEDAQLRGKTLYNLGNSQFKEALKAETDKKREEAIQHALDALDSFNAAARLGYDKVEVEENKSQAQHFLQFTANPPPQQQNQQNQDGQGEQGQQGDQSQNQQPQDQQGQQDQQQPQDGQDQQQQQPQSGDQPEQQQDQQPQDQPQEGEGEQEQQQQEQGEGQDQEEQQKGSSGGAKEKPVDLTPEQARELLNLLGNQDNIVLKKSRYPLTRPEPEKDW